MDPVIKSQETRFFPKKVCNPMIMLEKLGISFIVGGLSAYIGNQKKIKLDSKRPSQRELQSTVKGIVISDLPAVA